MRLAFFALSAQSIAALFGSNPGGAERWSAAISRKAKMTAPHQRFLGCIGLAGIALAAGVLLPAPAWADCVESGRPISSERQFYRMCRDCGGEPVGTRGSLQCLMPQAPIGPSPEQLEQERKQREAEANAAIVGVLKRDAGQAISRKDWPAALRTLKQAREIAPNDEEIANLTKTAESNLAREQAERESRRSMDAMMNSLPKNRDNLEPRGSSPVGALQPRGASSPGALEFKGGGSATAGLDFRAPGQPILDGRDDMAWR